MKRLSLSTLIALTFAITACGGGGGAGTAQTPDGTKVDLTNSPTGTVGAKTDNGTLIGYNGISSFYGVWKNDANTLKELRYQGTAATNIPTSGTATYKGNAIWISGYDVDFKQGGQTTLNVDFGRKTVDGKIEFSILNGDELRRDITLNQTTLNDSKFEGQASVIGNSSGRYEGALFGQNASEAAGVVHFQNESTLDVSFGGTKQ